MHLSHFGAYDPGVWTIQAELSALGYDPGPLDGLWGSNTADAARAFRDDAGLPWIGSDERGDLVDTAFGVAIAAALVAAGAKVPRAPTAAGAAVSPSIPAPPAGSGSSVILPLAIVAVGLFLIFGRKRG